MQWKVFSALLCTCGFAFAQHAHQPTGEHAATPYAGLQSRDIKALSAEQLDDLREGRGMGASLPAELNGVPGPLHVLQLQQRLHVTPGQASALQAIMEEMKTSAQRWGNEVIAAERELDRMFSSNSAREAEVRELSQRIGTLNAELRAVHLVAHLKTRQLMTDQQVAQYNALRGYSAGIDQHRPRPH